MIIIISFIKSLPELLLYAKSCTKKWSDEVKISPIAGMIMLRNVRINLILIHFLLFKIWLTLIVVDTCTIVNVQCAIQQYMFTPFNIGFSTCPIYTIKAVNVDFNIIGLWERTTDGQLFTILQTWRLELNCFFPVHNS